MTGHQVHTRYAPLCRLTSVRAVGAYSALNTYICSCMDGLIVLYIKYSIVYKCVNNGLNGKWWPVLDALSE